MALFQIINTVSESIAGCFEATDATAALDAMAREKGCADTASSWVAIAAARGKLVVELIPEGQIAVEQCGWGIVGVGVGHEAAFANAELWLDEDTTIDTIKWNLQPTDGEVRFVKITARLAQIRNSGSEYSWGTLPDGTLCTTQEAT